MSPFTNKFDFDTVDERYWTNIDSAIVYADKKGIAVFVAPMYLGNDFGGADGWYNELLTNGLTKCSNYGVFLGNRYKNCSNIVWVVGGDMQPNDTIKEHLRWWVDGIKAVDSTHTVITAYGANDGSSRNDFTGATVNYLTLNGLHGTTIADIASKTQTEYGLSPSSRSSSSSTSLPMASRHCPMGW